MAVQTEDEVTRLLRALLKEQKRTNELMEALAAGKPAPSAQKPAPPKKISMLRKLGGG